MTALWFLLGALVISAIGSAIVVLRHRKPTTEDWSVEEFRREMHAISPEAPRLQSVRPVRPVPPARPVNGARHAPGTVRPAPDPENRGR